MRKIIGPKICKDDPEYKKLLKDILNLIKEVQELKKQETQLRKKIKRRSKIKK